MSAWRLIQNRSLVPKRRDRRRAMGVVSRDLSWIRSRTVLDESFRGDIERTQEFLLENHADCGGGNGILSFA